MSQKRERSFVRERRSTNFQDSIASGGGKSQCNKPNLEIYRPPGKSCNYCKFHFYTYGISLRQSVIAKKKNIILFYVLGIRNNSGDTFRVAQFPPPPDVLINHPRLIKSRTSLDITLNCKISQNKTTAAKRSAAQLSTSATSACLTQHFPLQKSKSNAEGFEGRRLASIATIPILCEN